MDQDDRTRGAHDDSSGTGSKDSSFVEAATLLEGASLGRLDGSPRTLADAEGSAVTRPDGAAGATRRRVRMSERSDVENRLWRDPRFEERYERRAILGEGGMGTVELRVDRAIGREVALKRVKSSLAGTAALDRFVREARVQGQLEHPAIVPVHDLAEDAEGVAFFTMKRVRGKSLEEILEALAAGDPEARARFGRRKLLSAFSTVCLAVDFAHA